MMETNHRLYQSSMMSIVQLLGECAELPSELGIEDDLLYRLSKLDAYGQKLITTEANTFLSIAIDSDQLKRQIDQLTEKVSERELEDTFLIQLAPCKLMRELFGMHASEFSQRRRLLGLSNQGQHRPRACDKDVELSIWRHWRETHGMEERQRYLRVAERTGQTINVIYAAVRSYRATAPEKEALL